MNREQRREVYWTYMGTTLSRPNPLLRHVVVAYPPPELPGGGLPAEVMVNGQRPGVIGMIVRAPSLTSRQEAQLADHGFELETDDDPRYVRYGRAVDHASADDLATFVEWAYRVVLDAPEDYEPRVQPVGPRSETAAPGGGCLPAAVWGFLIAMSAVLVYRLAR